MHQSNKAIWFPAKRYGIGWGFPITWQGWVVVGMYLLLLAIGGIASQQSQLPLPFPFYLMLVTLLLITICYLKGEKPRWQWGDKP